MPTQIVQQLMLPDSDKNSMWTLTDGMLKSDSGGELDMSTFIQSKVELLDKLCKDFTGGDIEQHIVGKMHSMHQPDLVELASALDFASDFSLEFWTFCNWLNILDKDKYAEYKEEVWKVVKKLPMEWVLLKASEGCELAHTINLCEWPNTDTHLWLDLYLCTQLKMKHKLCMLTQKLVFYSVPAELHGTRRMLEVLIKADATFLLEEQLCDVPASTTFNDMIDACVDILCNTLNDPDYGWTRNCFAVVVRHIRKSESWWKLLKGYKILNIDKRIIDANGDARYFIIPEDIISYMFATNSRYTVALRHALTCRFPLDVGTIKLPAELTLGDDEEGIHANIVTVLRCLEPWNDPNLKPFDADSCVMRVLQILMQHKYLNIVRSVCTMLMPEFPVMSMAAKHLDASQFIQLNDVFRWDVDSSPNIELDKLFHGALCEVSDGVQCSVVLAKFVVRVKYKTVLQELQEDAFKISSKTACSECCIMCQNIYSAAKYNDRMAIDAFLQNP